ncbi:MAG TPA: DUF4382 domain-containing protein [Candidatus Polarisedimenticolia bacterium]|nr:DUF4382 domain-containing protein [Candidatus Polarisedimenticolia bacterium]
MRDTRVAPSVFFALALSVIALPFVTSCSDSSGSGPGTGTVNVRMTDAPIDLSTVQSVMVTIDGVILYGSGDDGDMPDVNSGGAIPIATHPDTFDLLTLTGGATTLLASGEAPAGRYQRIRLEVSKAELIFKDGTIEPLKLESGKVDVPIAFDLGVDETQTLTLDFDAEASVQVNETASDKFILRPVVTPVH